MIMESLNDCGGDADVGGGSGGGGDDGLWMIDD